MNRVKIYLWGTILLCLQSYNGQEVISSQGNSTSNSAGSLDYTIGEVVIAFGSDSINHLTQGFHQPVFEITNIEDNAVDFEVVIYPNPAVDQLNIFFKNYKIGCAFYLFDSMGKQLLESNITSKEMTLPFSNYSTGVYFLVINDINHKKIKTYKIQKSH